MKSVVVWTGLCFCVAVLAFYCGFATRGASDSVRDTVVRGHFARTLFALDNYHRKFGSFPPTSGTEKSWRVSLAEEYTVEFFKGYDETIPWDAPANLEWSERVGRCPSDFSAHPDNSDVSRMFISTDLTKWKWRKPVLTRVHSVGDHSVVIVFDPDSVSHWLDPNN